VLIGWNATREAARAVNDAMPLLQGAEFVTVLTIDAREGPDAHGELPGADISLHLARHGVKAEIERTVSAGIPAGDVLFRARPILAPTSWSSAGIPGFASCCSAGPPARSCKA
jgi:hypothetical protein